MPIVDLRNALIDDSFILKKVLVQLHFIEKLRVFGVHRLELHCDFDVVLDIDALEDFTERA